MPSQSNSLILKLVYDDGREELVNRDRQSTVEPGDRISPAAKLTNPVNATAPAKSPIKTVRPPDQAGSSESRHTKRSIQPTASPVSERDKRTKFSSDENNDRNSSNRKDDDRMRDNDDQGQDSIICLSSDEEQVDQRTTVSRNKPTTSPNKKSCPSKSSSSDRRPAEHSNDKKSNPNKTWYGRKLTRYQPLASSSDDDDDLINPANEVFDIIPEPSDRREPSVQRVSSESSSDDERPADTKRHSKRNESNRSKEQVNYKDPSTSSISSEWSTSGSESYSDIRLYNRRKHELMLQKLKKLEREKLKCFTEPNNHHNDPNYSPRTSNKFIDDTVWKIADKKRGSSSNTKMPL